MCPRENMTVTIHNEAEIGQGIYSVPDVALILDLPSSKVRHWLNEYWDSRFGKAYEGKYSWGEGRQKAVNFHTLIEFYLFYKLRELGISAQKIVKAHSIMADKLHTQYPFASAKILTEGKKYILFQPDQESLMRADEKLQLEFKRIVEPFCNNIDFDSNAIAQRFYPKGKKSKIVVDPHHQFGQPVIQGTNIAAETLFRMHEAGESMIFIANVYEIDKKSVSDAINFYKTAA